MEKASIQGHTVVREREREREGERERERERERGFEVNKVVNFIPLAPQEILKT